MVIMPALTEYQINALRLYRQGETLTVIRRRVQMRSKSPKDAIERAQHNILLAIQTLKIAIENDLLEENQIRDLKLILSKA
jgi:transcriptional regulator